MWGELMSTLEGDFPPESGYQVWEFSPPMVEAVLAASVRKRQDQECLMVAPPAPQERAPDFIVDRVDWPCMPTSKPSRVKYTAFRKADNEFVWVDYHTSRIPSGFDQLKITYRSLACRSEVWSPHTDLQV